MPNAWPVPPLRHHNPRSLSPRVWKVCRLVLCYAHGTSTAAPRNLYCFIRLRFAGATIASLRGERVDRQLKEYFVSVVRAQPFDFMSWLDTMMVKNSNDLGAVCRHYLNVLCQDQTVSHAPACLNTQFVFDHRTPVLVLVVAGTSMRN